MAADYVSVAVSQANMECSQLFRPARVEAKFGKGPNGVGNVLGVELGDEIEAEISSPL